MGVLGIDTSCYTTSVAYVAEDGTILQERRILQVPKGNRGLMQSNAVFQHVQNLPELLDQLKSKVGKMQIRAVCASTKPRPVEGSYMPVFLVGSGMARSIATALDVPFLETTHQQGHIQAALQGSGMPQEAASFLAVHLSGGTTELLYTGRDLHVELLGGTEDLHAGQFVDRTGVALGLPFPCGPHLEKLAIQGQAQSRIPLSAKGLAIHFSGAEAQVQRWIASATLSPEDIAAEVYSYLSRAVAHLLIAGQERTGCTHALLAGGVSSSALFRALLPQRIARKGSSLRVFWGKPEFSADNAVGVALIGQNRLQNPDSMDEV